MAVNPTLSVIQDKRSKKINLTYPVKLRVTYQRDRLYINMGLSFTEDEFKKIMSQSRVSEIQQEHRKTISDIQSKANTICNETRPFSLEKFKQKFFQDEQKKVQTLSDTFENYIDKLNSRDGFKYASSFKDTLSSINRFKKGVDFENITPEWLEDYERWIVIKNERSITTVTFHTHNLRTIFNHAIHVLKIISNDYYPFGKGGYTIPSRIKSKVFLTSGELKRLWDVEVEELSTRHFVKDMFFFSYFCNGIYLKEIANLKYKDVSGNKIEIFRNKIVSTRRIDLKSNIILLNPKSKEVIERWGNKPKQADQYIFPIYTQGCTNKQKERLIDNFRSNYNKRMKEMVEVAGIDKVVTSKIARHSFSNQLLNSGASKSFIGEMLAHSNSKTTEHYLHGFDDGVKEETLNKLDIFD